MKTCSWCGESKSKSEFYRRSAAPDGLYARCKSCSKRRREEYHKENGHLTNARKRAWYKENRTAVCQRQREYAQRSPQQTLTSSLWRALHRCPTANPVTGRQLMAMFTAQDGRCALSGIKMTWLSGLGMPAPSSVTIDRIDQSLGYEFGNVRLLCHCVNAFRGSMADEELLRYLDTFHRHQFREPAAIQRAA